MSGFFRQVIRTAAILCLIAEWNGIAFAQTIPGPADVGRVNKPVEAPPAPTTPEVPIPQIPEEIAIPKEAHAITLELKDVTIDGATAFTPAQLADIYKPYIGHTVTLDVVWIMAAQITKRYRDAGYFLSRAYVPKQEIEGGKVRIVVVEGYIAEVALDNPISKHRIVEQLISRIIAEKPIKTKALESLLLQLNDLPGVSFRAIIEPLGNGPEGAARLRLEPSGKSARGSVTYNNGGSRFLGPYQFGATIEGSIIPMQQTRVSMLTSVPTKEIKYIEALQQIPLCPQWSLLLSGSYAKARPGYTLADNDIDGISTDLGIGLSYQAIRQREENLQWTVMLDGKDVSVDTHDTLLTRDHIRAVRGNMNYAAHDFWNGYDTVSVTLSRGLGILGASKGGDPDLSRAEAKPDFTKAEFSVLRQQYLAADFLLSEQATGQWSSDPLFASEEFGYGGPYLGRAYDTSEITGDSGLAGALELSYQGIPAWRNLTVSPFIFYDIGEVWNKDTGSEPISASSAGAGIKFQHSSGLSGSLSLAQPLTRRQEAPLSGDGKNPRVFFEISYGF